MPNPAPHAMQNRLSGALSVSQLAQRIALPDVAGASLSVPLEGGNAKLGRYSRSMILDRTPPSSMLRPLSAAHHNRVEALAAKFAKAFPEVTYEIAWATRSLNAQAFLLEGRRFVRVYGGLVRHRQVGEAGIAWALAHETGHHLGEPPMLEHFPWLCSERSADAWALARGLPTVLGPGVARRTATMGRRELKMAHRMTTAHDNGKAGC